MLKRLITIALLLVIAGFVASFLRDQEGTTVLEWMGWRIEAKTSLLIVIAIALVWLVIVIDRIIGMVARLPGRFSGAINERRQKQGHHALAIGLVAASAGDGREALRQAKKAKRLMGAEPLTELLQAQAAGLTGDPDAARRYFENLSQEKETAFFGKAGLMRLDAERGDDKAALAMGREAFRLNNKTPSMAKALYALEARHGHWDNAIEALSVAERDPSMSAQSVQAGFATLYYCQALALIHEEVKDQIVIKTLVKGLGHDPGLAPLVLASADCYQRLGKTKKAQSVLETGFKKNPNPEICLKLFEIMGEDEKALAALIRFAEKNGNPSDGLKPIAGLALRFKLWGEVKRLLALVPEDDQDLSYWQVYASFAEHADDESHEGEDRPDRGYALMMAAQAKRPLGWTCQECHHSHQEWAPHCDNCGYFASVAWR